MKIRAFRRKLERDHTRLRHKLHQALSEANFPLRGIERCRVEWDENTGMWRVVMWAIDPREPPYVEPVRKHRDFPTQDTINRLLLFI